MDGMQYILFDLDGTLTDSGPGIINAIQYALKGLGMAAEDPPFSPTALSGRHLPCPFLRYMAFHQKEPQRPLRCSTSTMTDRAFMRINRIQVFRRCWSS